MAGKLTNLTPKGGQPRKPRREWKEKFLTGLRESPDVTAAAKAAHVSRQRVYQVYKSDKNFAAAFDDAIEQSIDAAVGEAYRRAVQGVTKPIMWQGDKVAEVQEYSDSLLTFLLRSHRPNTYRETTRAENLNVDLKTLTDEQIERLAKGESLAAVLATASAS